MQNKYIKKNITTDQKNSKDESYKKIVLPNGIRILVEEIPGSLTFALGVGIDAGSRDDPESRSGLAHFLEHASFRRTKTRTSRQISVGFESLGAYANAFTSKEITCFYVTALNHHFGSTFKLLADIIVNPVFLQKEMDKERSIILEEISSLEDDPEEQIFDYGDNLLFGENNLSKPIAGFKQSVEAIGIDDLNSFRNKFYTGDRIIISASGNINADTIAGEAEKLFQGVNGYGGEIVRSIPESHVPKRNEMKLDYQQAHILLCSNVPGGSSEERYPLAMLNVILGDGMSSRLNQRLREKNGLAYTVYSSLQMFSDCGVLNIYAATDPKNLNKIERLITEELTKFGNGDINIKEINRAKEQLKSSTIMALESMSSRMQALIKSELTLGYYESPEATLEAIDSVTKDNLMSIAEKYFTASRWNTVVFEVEEEEE